MPWKEQTTMSERKEFIRRALQPGRNMSQLCREYGISRKTGYKWLKRYQDEGEAGLANRSRRPKHSPWQTAPEVEARVLALRKRHPAWGGRKLNARLRAMGKEPVPSPSTITAILQRSGCIREEESQKRKAYQRFEKERPNEMWQMDFKGYFQISGENCHPLTVLDDHSRYLVGLQACSDQKRETVEAHLRAIFRQYGLPEKILTDNAGPWGPASGEPFYTKMSVWLIRLGIGIVRSRPYHPQTLGKDERLHRSLNEEVITQHRFSSFQECQDRFDDWQQIYNTQRPHEALNLEPPASRFEPSARVFPETLPAINYSATDQVRKVDRAAYISFKNVKFRIGRAFVGLPVAVRPSTTDGVFDVYFCRQKIKTISILEVEC